MKKQILSVAVASVMLGPVVALADIRLYGRAHVSFDQLDDGDRNGLNVSSNSSRLGFRANHEINENLTATMQIEQNIRYENGAGSFASRDSFVGLRGNFGLVRLGFFNTPLKLIRNNTDFFSDQIGDARNMTRVRDGYSGNDYDFDARFRNSVHYRTPAIGGVTVDIHYSTNTDASTTVTNDNDALSGSLTYRNGGIYLAGAYERKNDSGSDAARFGFGYSFGDFQLSALAQFATVKDATGFATDQEVDTVGLGGSYSLNDKVTIKAQYYMISADGEERDANMTAVGLDYRIASPFRLLFAYAKTSNDNNATYSMSRGGHGTQIATVAPGLDHSGFSIGFRYDF